jgi:alpha-glucosidase
MYMQIEETEVVCQLIIGEKYYELKNNNLKLRLYFLVDDTVRIRYSFRPEWERDFSYAIEKIQYKEISPLTVEEKALEFVFEATGFKIRVSKQDLSISIVDHLDKIISEDYSALSFEEHYENGTFYTKGKRKIQHGEHFYGLGDKSEHPDLRGKKFSIYGSDTYGFYRHTDPLYKNIPFFIGLHHGVSYGIFLDNTYKTSYDFGHVVHDVCEVMTYGGEYNYYFIYGPEMVDVSRKYTLLTGTPEMPPLWALGYHQCKWSYYPESQVREICHGLRDRDIPCDAMYLDIDYMDGFRCFTWDNSKFPQPAKMIADLKTQGFKTIVIIDPGIKIDENYPVFTEALSRGYFCKSGDGGYARGEVWPGECYFPDFTDPEVRNWWADLFKELIADCGVKGVWNDMNEPALFNVPNKTFPSDVRHNYDGEPCSHRKAHNIYGMQMTRASYEGVKKYSYPDRPFLITRSTYSGGQKYSSVWTGDNIASWEHVWIANVMTQRLSICGFSFVGSDVGGFIDSPSPELYMRYIQLATLHPFFRTHSSGDHGDQEPWSFGEEVLSVVREYIKLRYKLLPYIYTTFYQYVQFGTPMLRPIYMVDQHDMHTHYRADEVMHGDHLLYAPILEEDTTSRSLYLPKGIWYDYFSHKPYVGGKEIVAKFNKEHSPLFARAGAIIPIYPVMDHVGQKPIEQLTLDVYFVDHGITRSYLYEDDGDGYGYTEGRCNFVSFEFIGGANTIEIKQHRPNTFNPQYKTYRVNFFGLPYPIKSCYVNGSSVDVNYLQHLDLDFDTLVIQLI